MVFLENGFNTNLVNIRPKSGIPDPVLSVFIAHKHLFVVYICELLEKQKF